MWEAGFVNDGTARVKSYQIGATLSNAGIPVCSSVLANVDGVLAFSTTAGLMAIGLALDNPGTRLTAQQTDGSDPARYVTVSVRPDLIYGARLSGSATSGTALTETSNTAASTDGLLITTTANQSAYDDGVAWGATGANAGIIRKITAVTTTSTPIIAFPRDLAVGDTFYFCTFHKGERAGLQLTSDFTQFDASGDNQAAQTFRCYDFFHKPKAARGATETEVHAVICEHLYRFSGTAAS